MFNSDCEFLDCDGICDGPNQPDCNDECGGNALIDDCMWARLKKNYDENGNLSFKGKLNKSLLNEFLNDEYFNIYRNI